MEVGPNLLENIREFDPGLRASDNQILRSEFLEACRYCLLLKK